MVKIMRRLSLTGGTKEPARSKAVDDLLDTDLDLELADSSMRSFASSITSPPSQSGSFYHRVQKQNEDSELQRKYGYDNDNMTGNLPDDWVSESTDDDDAQSTNSWGGFPNKSAAQSSDATSDSGMDSSVRSSPIPTRKGVKKSRSNNSRMKNAIKDPNISNNKNNNINMNTNNKKKKKVKKKKRLKDFFRKSAEKHEPITEVDEADLITANSENNKEGLEGSMSLPPMSDANLKADTDSHSEQHSTAHSQYSKGSSRSGKGGSQRRKAGRRQLSPAAMSRTSNSPKNSPRSSPRNSPRMARGRKTKKGKASLDRNSAHSGPANGASTTTTSKQRRGSFGALTRRMSLGAKSDDGDNKDFGEASEQPTKNTRRGSIGNTTEGGETRQGRRSSLGSMLGSVVRRASLGGNDSAATPKQKGPVIPDDFHNIIHRERAARNMYLFQRDFVLDTIAQGIANDLAAGRAPTPCEFYGNIGKGTSLSVIHSKIMEERKGVSRKNILSQRFKVFGMGLAIGGAKNESIFMCTLFRE